MKPTKKIITEQNYKNCLNSESGSFQEDPKFYVTYGTVGISLIRLSDRKEKTVNSFREVSYKELCDVFDALTFE